MIPAGSKLGEADGPQVPHGANLFQREESHVHALQTEIAEAELETVEGGIGIEAHHIFPHLESFHEIKVFEKCLWQGLDSVHANVQVFQVLFQSTKGLACVKKTWRKTLMSRF